MWYLGFYLAWCNICSESCIHICGIILKLFKMGVLSALLFVVFINMISRFERRQVQGDRSNIFVFRRYCSSGSIQTYFQCTLKCSEWNAWEKISTFTIISKAGKVWEAPLWLGVRHCPWPRNFSILGPYPWVEEKDWQINQLMRGGRNEVPLHSFWACFPWWATELSINCLENICESYRKRWSLWLGIKKSELTSSACCHYDPHRKRKNIEKGIKEM